MLFIEFSYCPQHAVNYLDQYRRVLCQLVHSSSPDAEQELFTLRFTSRCH